MKYTLTISLLLFAVSGAAAAQEHNPNSSMHDMQSMPQAAAQANTGIGTVNRVDMQSGKVNLTHGPIRSLGWPGMTMDFAVQNRALLAGLRPGDKVEFDVAKEGPGRFYIVRIVPAR